MLSLLPCPPSPLTFLPLLLPSAPIVSLCSYCLPLLLLPPSAPIVSFCSCYLSLPPYIACLPLHCCIQLPPSAPIALPCFSTLLVFPYIATFNCLPLLLLPVSASLHCLSSPAFLSVLTIYPVFPALLDLNLTCWITSKFLLFNLPFSLFLDNVMCPHAL